MNNPQDFITCSLCGHRFSPSGNAACPTCPLNKGCKMVCCPACGNTNIDPSQSSVVRFIKRLVGARSNESVA